MKLLAGIDIGNSTTEVCIAQLKENKDLKFLSTSMVKTTGMKGTLQNVRGIVEALEIALTKINKSIKELDLIRINEATPVIGDTAMETITETIITESTMIGHNPSTPGGVGLGLGIIVDIKNYESLKSDEKYILVIPKEVDYEKGSSIINECTLRNIQIVGAIVQKDEGVLINNRINIKIPIVDEVKYIEKIPYGSFGSVEVAMSGKTIRTLSNPYGIATIFGLDAEETKRIVPVAKSLIGTRSAVVIKTPKGEVEEKIIKAGTLFILSQNRRIEVPVDLGAEKIMEAMDGLQGIDDLEGESGTNISGMINSVKSTLANLTEEDISEIKIKDLFAIDTNIKVAVQGALAGETYNEKAVATAVMVKTHKLPMNKIAKNLESITGVFVSVAGVEAVMASIGALTTPGVKLPLAILDLGGGSTDAAIIDEKGEVRSIHMAGAGELVTMLINVELNLEDRNLAEEIKKNPVAKVESLFHIKMESGEIRFFDKPLDAKFYGRVVIVSGDELLPIFKDITLEKIVYVRREAKRKVFINNSLRALKNIAPMNNIRNIPNVVIVGGCALDFEIPEMILNELSKFKITAGSGNIIKTEGPRKAVAAGLVLEYLSR